MEQKAQKTKKTGYKLPVLITLIAIAGILGAYKPAFAVYPDNYCTFGYQSNGNNLTGKTLIPFTNTTVGTTSIGIKIYQIWNISDTVISYDNEITYDPSNPYGTCEMYIINSTTNYQDTSIYFNGTGIKNVSAFPDGNYYATQFIGASKYLFFTMTDGVVSEYDPIVSCYDGILNQDELLIDIGGVCGYDYLTNESGMSLTSPAPSEIFYESVLFGGQYTHTTQEAYNNILLYVVNATTEEGATFLIPIDPANTLDGIFSQEIPLESGAYYVLARQYNSVNYTFGAWFPEAESELFAFGVYDSATTPPAYVPETCDTGDLFCYMRNAFKWAFTLDTNQFAKFSTLDNEISNKAPFGYAKLIFGELGNIINDADHKVFVLQGITPITDTIFTPIRTALSWLLYFIFGFTLFHRFKNIQI